MSLRIGYRYPRIYDDSECAIGRTEWFVDCGGPPDTIIDGLRFCDVHAQGIENDPESLPGIHAELAKDVYHTYPSEAPNK